MKIYISGPISGYEDSNLMAFRDVAGTLEIFGHTTLVPHDIPGHKHEGDCPSSYAISSDGHHSAACMLRTDLQGLLECEGIFMLHGWEASIGARLEHSVASHCGMPIGYQGRGNAASRFFPASS